MLDLDGWRAGSSVSAVLLGHVAALRRNHLDEAKKWLDDAAVRCDTSAWPYPIVKYLRGELDEAKLLADADNNDKAIKARCYVGLDLVQKGQNQAALGHFRWIKEHGNPRVTEYAISIAEAKRLEARK